MSIRNTWALAAAALLIATTASAQDDAAERQQAIDTARDARQIEERVLRERERQHEKQLGRYEVQRVSAQEAAQQKDEIRIQMREAEEKLAEAARRIAELSSRNLPHVEQNIRAIVAGDGKPRLGITIGSDDEGPVEGVEVDGITPGSAAADAGLRAGDVLTRVNDENLSAATSAEANAKLLDFMGGVEPGDRLRIEYLRDGKVGSVELEPRPVELREIIISGPDDFDFKFFGDPNRAPKPDRNFSFGFRFPWSSWGDMELVELSEGLGRYFGTDKGLLVISAPKSGELKLEDGDVIQSIDGREPTSVGHAMRILGSYEPGEEVELRIMRDKRRQTLKVEMPDERRSWVMPPAAPLPGKAPAALPPDVPVPLPDADAST